MKFLDYPPVWLAFFLTLGWCQDIFWPVAADYAPLRVLGICLTAVGLIVTSLAVVQFKRHRTTIIPRKTPNAIITTGVFAYSRNPIYLADALILLGAAMIWQSWLAAILVPIFVWLIDARFIRGEEAGLRKMFGPEFDVYASRVRRWI